MIIEAPVQEDIPRLRQLWQESFGDTDEYLDKFFGIAFSCDRSRCVRVDGQIVAALYWFECSLEYKKVAYIYAVATDPAFRRQGYCEKLMIWTHWDLYTMGYVGAVLVPGSRELFPMYEKLGYQSFCPMTEERVLPGEPINVRTINEGEYGYFRRQYMPPGTVFQEGVSLIFLLEVFELYAFAGGFFSANRVGDTLYVQEYCGIPFGLEKAVAGLGCKEAVFYRYGKGEHRAMFKPFVKDAPVPAYFGIPFN